MIREKTNFQVAFEAIDATDIQQGYLAWKGD